MFCIRYADGTAGLENSRVYGFPEMPDKWIRSGLLYSRCYFIYRRFSFFFCDWNGTSDTLTEDRYRHADRMRYRYVHQKWRGAL